MFALQLTKHENTKNMYMFECDYSNSQVWYSPNDGAKARLFNKGS